MDYPKARHTTDDARVYEEMPSLYTPTPFSQQPTRLHRRLPHPSVATPCSPGNIFSFVDRPPHDRTPMTDEVIEKRFLRYAPEWSAVPLAPMEWWHKEAAKKIRRLCVEYVSQLEFNDEMSRVYTTAIVETTRDIPELALECYFHLIRFTNGNPDQTQVKNAWRLLVQMQSRVKIPTILETTLIEYVESICYNGCVDDFIREQALKVWMHIARTTIDDVIHISQATLPGQGQTTAVYQQSENRIPFFNSDLPSKTPHGGFVSKDVAQFSDIDAQMSWKLEALENVPMPLSTAYSAQLSTSTSIEHVSDLFIQSNAPVHKTSATKSAIPANSSSAQNVFAMSKKQADGSCSHQSETDLISMNSTASCSLEISIESKNHDLQHQPIDPIYANDGLSRSSRVIGEKYLVDLQEKDDDFEQAVHVDSSDRVVLKRYDPDKVDLEAIRKLHRKLMNVEGICRIDGLVDGADGPAIAFEAGNCTLQEWMRVNRALFGDQLTNHTFPVMFCQILDTIRRVHRMEFCVGGLKATSVRIFSKSVPKLLVTLAVERNDAAVRSDIRDFAKLLFEHYTGIQFPEHRGLGEEDTMFLKPDESKAMIKGIGDRTAREFLQSILVGGVEQPDIDCRSTELFSEDSLPRQISITSLASVRSIKDVNSLLSKINIKSKVLEPLDEVNQTNLLNVKTKRVPDVRDEACPNYKICRLRTHRIYILRLKLDHKFSSMPLIENATIQLETGKYGSEPVKLVAVLDQEVTESKTGRISCLFEPDSCEGLGEVAQFIASPALRYPRVRLWISLNLRDYEEPLKLYHDFHCQFLEEDALEVIDSLKEKSLERWRSLPRSLRTGIREAGRAVQWFVNFFGLLTCQPIGAV